MSCSTKILSLDVAKKSQLFPTHSCVGTHHYFFPVFFVPLLDGFGFDEAFDFLKPAPVALTGNVFVPSFVSNVFV